MPLSLRKRRNRVHKRSSVVRALEFDFAENERCLCLPRCFLNVSSEPDTWNTLFRRRVSLAQASNASTAAIISSGGVTRVSWNVTEYVVIRPNAVTRRESIWSSAVAAGKDGRSYDFVEAVRLRRRAPTENFGSKQPTRPKRETTRDPCFPKETF